MSCAFKFCIKHIPIIVNYTVHVIWSKGHEMLLVNSQMNENICIFLTMFDSSDFDRVVTNCW